jgi:hypothetical protein
MRNKRIIDIHCHYPTLNTEISDLSELNISTIGKIAIKYHSRSVNSRWTEDIEELRVDALVNFSELINSSIIDNFVVLAWDGIYDSKGELDTDRTVMYVSNDSVKELSIKEDKVLFGASINPQRKDCFEELERVALMKAALIKFHPTFQHFNPKKKQYQKFYKRIAELKIPILIHIGPEFAGPGIKTIKEYESIDNLIPILEQGATVIAAHGMGTSVMFDSVAFREVEAMLRRYPNLYVDNSATTVPHRKKRALSMLKSELALERTLYGTDFPVRPHLKFFLNSIPPKKSAEIILNVGNILDRDLEIKKAIGFPDETFSRGYDLLNL